MARSHDTEPPLVAVEPRRAPVAWGAPAAFDGPVARRGPLLLARARLHWVALLPRLLANALLVGAALGLIALIHAALPPLGLALLTLALCAALFFTLLLPLAAWCVFEIRIFDDRVVVHELRGVLRRGEQYPLSYSLVMCERWPWDYALGTGTIILASATRSRRFRWVTPVGWFDWIVFPWRS